MAWFIMEHLPEMIGFYPKKQPVAVSIAVAVKLAGWFRKWTNPRNG